MKKLWQKIVKNNGFLPDKGRKEGVRHFPRIPADGLVRIKSSDKDYSAYLVNISREGLMTKARDLPEPNEEIAMSFRLLPSNRLLQMKGVVVWTAPMGRPEWQKSMGVRFVDQELNNRTGVKDYISRFYSGMPV